jgi:hypothetical protein
MNEGMPGVLIQYALEEEVIHLPYTTAPGFLNRIVELQLRCTEFEKLQVQRLLPKTKNDISFEHLKKLLGEYNLTETGNP